MTGLKDVVLKVSNIWTKSHIGNAEEDVSIFTLNSKNEEKEDDNARNDEAIRRPKFENAYRGNNRNDGNASGSRPNYYKSENYRKWDNTRTRDNRPRWYNCNKTGHYARACWSNPRNNYHKGKKENTREDTTKNFPN
ncbi:hypothetical protein TcasGA2_TC001906 [Tribolium castaneum]|uniref:CCHC-type domain-containing protein n=1 Tax=Tribolium castaneum TaxID=7070 RepID=D2CG64_TRICA|nr:hypothetical protein TcasGA2_TC001906 [Tribolium castaneum]